VFRWSLPLGRLFGIQFSVHFTFLLVVGYAGWVGWDIDGANGMVWSVAALLAFFTCVVLHELGHTAMARRFGIRVPRIRILPIGGMAEFESIPREPRREFLISIAGPAVNFVLAAALWLVVDLDIDWNSPAALYSPDGLIRQLFFANLVMGCFNLLPVFPMDGGRILRALLATRMRYLRATFWAATVGKFGAVLAMGLAAYFGLYLVVVLFAFIILVGEMEYRMAKRREYEAAYLREMQARAYDLLRAGESPPPS